MKSHFSEVKASQNPKRKEEALKLIRSLKALYSLENQEETKNQNKEEYAVKNDSCEVIMNFEEGIQCDQIQLLSQAVGSPLQRESFGGQANVQYTEQNLSPIKFESLPQSKQKVQIESIRNSKSINPKPILKTHTSYPIEGELQLSKKRKLYDFEQHSQSQVNFPQEVELNHQAANQQPSLFSQSSSKRFKHNDEIQNFTEEPKEYDLSKIRQLFGKESKTNQSQQQMSQHIKLEPLIKTENQFHIPAYSQTINENHCNNQKNNDQVIINDNVSNVGQADRFSFCVPSQFLNDESCEDYSHSNKENCLPYEIVKDIVEEEDQQNDENQLQLISQNLECLQLTEAQNQIIQENQNKQRQPLGEIPLIVHPQSQEQMVLQQFSQNSEFQQYLAANTQKEKIDVYDSVKEEATQVIFDEFMKCNSEYLISDKDSDSAISSDGEFMDANKINIYNEDDSYVDVIENIKERNFIRDNIYSGFGFNKEQNQFRQLKTFQRSQSQKKDFSRTLNQSEKQKPKTKRDKGLKYFTKVGYTKERLKSIPRWCTDIELLDRMVIYQKKNPQLYDTDKIFGKFNPKALELNLHELFGPQMRNLKKQMRFNKRGSSAQWNDDNEFLTPIDGPKQVGLTGQSTVESGPQVSSFSPFGIKKGFQFNHSMVVQDNKPFKINQYAQKMNMTANNMTTNSILEVRESYSDCDNQN